jgi:hypothetical protein
MNISGVSKISADSKSIKATFNVKGSSELVGFSFQFKNHPELAESISKLALLLEDAFKKELDV